MTPLLLTWIIICVVIAIAFVIALYLWVRAISTRMEITECLSLGADFAVITNQDATSSQEFVVNDLNDAFDTCNQEVCERFIYSESQKLMKIISSNTSTTPSNLSNLFIRQTNTISN